MSVLLQNLRQHILPRIRYEEIRKLKICMNCLRFGHQRVNAQPAVHFESSQVTENPRNSNLDNIATIGSAQSTSHNSAEPAGLVSANVSTLNATNVDHGQHVILSTAMINVTDFIGNQISFSALLDSGLQSNFIIRHLFKKLPSKPINISTQSKLKIPSELTLADANFESATYSRDC